MWNLIFPTQLAHESVLFAHPQVFLHEWTHIDDVLTALLCHVAGQV